MGRGTEIQWCDDTINPSAGCDGCELWTSLRRSCYAGNLHVHFPTNPGFAPSFAEVKVFPGRMSEAARWSDLTGKERPKKPWLNRLPRLIFVSDMGDSLSEAVTFEFLAAEVIANVTSDFGRRHQWLWLTKRPARMAEFSSWLDQPWPSNLWAGTSISTQATATRITGLLNVGNQDTIKFVSVEPQVEPIDLSRWLPHLSWVIQGGESGRGPRPFQIEWARSLLQQCREHRIPYFLKQLGSVVHRRGARVTFDDGHAGDWSEWPAGLRVRRFPI